MLQLPRRAEEEPEAEAEEEIEITPIDQTQQEIEAMLAAAREEADFLLVLVNSDASVRALKGPTRPLQCEDDRAFLLCSLKAVDKCVIFDSPRCDRELEALAPDVYVKGGDYTEDSLDPGERAALKKSQSKIVFISFVPGHSSTNIIRKMQS